MDSGGRRKPTATTVATTTPSWLARRRDRAVLVVAHRLSTVRDAQHIVVLDDGRTVGAGSHATLMSTCPEYSLLVHGRTDGAGTHHLQVTG